MKKVLAALAASAVAVSMLAFAGCGDKEDNGSIKGDYVEKTPEQMEEIIDKIDPDKVFSEDIAGFGLKVNLEAGASMGSDLNFSGKVNAEYKYLMSESGIAGSGNATVKFNYNGYGEKWDDESEDYVSVPVSYSGDLKGTLYNDSQYAYGTVTGKFNGNDLKNEDGSDMKAKVNFMELIGSVTGSGSVSGVSSLLEGAPEGMDIATLLQMADTFGIKVTVDDSNGIKFKLSASQETVWAVVAFAAGDKLSADMLTVIQSKVTFNKFQFDAYLSLDKDGVFSAASVVVDIDAKVSKELLNSEADLSVNAKGSIELTVNTASVTLPAGIATDESYFDATDFVADMLEDMMGSDNDYGYDSEYDY